MKKLFLFTAIISTFMSVSIAQDIKIKKNIVSVNGEEEIRIEEKSSTSFILKSLDDDEDLVFMKLIDPTPDMNPELNDNFFRLQFPDHDGEVEYKDYRKPVIIKFLYTHKVIEKGKINIENLNAFMDRYQVK